MLTTNGPTVFRYPSEREVRQLLIGVAVVIVAVTVSHFMYTELPVTRLAFGLLLIICLNLAGQKHRRIEISEHEVAYRPMFWFPRRAKFADIISIEKAKVAQGWVSRSGSHVVPGMLLQRPDHLYPMAIPLNLPNGDDVFDKITKAWERERGVRHAG
jgi:hypothetical protein